MSLQLWLAFVAATAVLLIIPGPTILTVISYSMAHGKRANIPLVAAVALGDSTALVVSLFGLGALVGGVGLLVHGGQTGPAACTCFTWASSFCAPAFRPCRPRRPRRRAPCGSCSATPTWSPPSIPKGIVFFVAFLPQFINPAADVTRQLWVLATTFVVMAGLNATLYAVFAASARTLAGFAARAAAV